MTTVPTQVTHEQRRDACRALGLPPGMVADLRLHPREGVRASLYVLDREGRRIAHGDQSLTADVHIPFAQGVTTP